MILDTDDFIQILNKFDIAENTKLGRTYTDYIESMRAFAEHMIALDRTKLGGVELGSGKQSNEARK